MLQLQGQTYPSSLLSYQHAQLNRLSTRRHATCSRVFSVDSTGDAQLAIQSCGAVTASFRWRCIADHLPLPTEGWCHSGQRLHTSEKYTHIHPHRLAQPTPALIPRRLYDIPRYDPGKCELPTPLSDNKHRASLACRRELPSSKRIVSIATFRFSHKNWPSELPGVARAILCRSCEAISSQDFPAVPKKFPACGIQSHSSTLHAHRTHSG